MSEFKAIYGVEDGYVGQSASQKFYIDSSEIEDDMDESEIRELYNDMMQNDFEQKVSPYGKNEDEFVEWAKEIILNMEDE